MPPDDTSAGLLLRARDRRNRHAWDRLVDLYTPLLADWLRRYRIPPHDADDIVQEVLLTVARELPAFDYDPARGSFRGWLRTIFANRVRHFLRTRARSPAVAAEADALDALADPHGDTGRAWDEEHDRHVLARLLQAIQTEFESRTWTAFRRIVIGGEMPAAVAADLGMSVDSVYQARSRVLSRLRREAAAFLD